MIDEVLIFKTNDWGYGWGETGPLPRYDMPSVMLNDDLWWIAGGTVVQSPRNDTPTTVIYEAGTNSFVPFVNLPQGMSQHSLVRVNSTSVIVAGWRDSYLDSEQKIITEASNGLITTTTFDAAGRTLGVSQSNDASDTRCRG